MKTGGLAGRNNRYGKRQIVVHQKAFRPLLVLLIAFLIATPVRAQSVEEFYADKTITLYIGYTVGGGYDIYARLVARHIGKYISGNPTVVPSNMPGAGSLKLMNWLYNAAPRDGTVLGSVNRGVPFLPLVSDGQLARFDAREFVWIGSTTDDIGVCVAWERTGITRFDQLYEQELIIGTTGPGSDGYVFPKLVRGILGVRLRSIEGYAGGNEINFAMERGEVDGRCGWTWSSVKSTRPDWLENGSINILLQLALSKHPDLPETTSIMELAENEEERQILRLILLRGHFGRPFLAPPDVPSDRAEALRTAFDAMVLDPDFLAEAEQSRADITPVPGAALEQFLAEAYATPPHILERVKMLLR